MNTTLESSTANSVAPIDLVGVSKRYPSRAGEIVVLRNISLQFQAKTQIAITGPSGAGKSTLLHLIGGLESPTEGTVRVAGINPYSLTKKGLANFRSKSVGFVFQDHHLLPQLSVIENVVLPAMAFGAVDEGTINRGKYLLHRVGLFERIDHLPAELSGGERQRVALCRALINRPAVLLCDEPTGNLDRRSAEVIANLLHELSESETQILLIVTHSLDLAKRCARRFELVDGELSEIAPSTSSASAG